MVESEPSQMAYDLHDHFLSYGFTWKDSGGVPSPEQIEEALVWMNKRLEKEKDGSTVWGGRLSMTKNGNRRDVFAHFGDYNE